MKLTDEMKKLNAIKQLLSETEDNKVSRLVYQTKHDLNALGWNYEKHFKASEKRALKKAIDSFYVFMNSFLKRWEAK